jgi:hypothetical protein
MEPDNEWDRFIVDFDKKVDVLFDDLDHPADIENGEYTFASSSGALTQETRYMRYEKIGRSAKEVADHFMNPTMRFYLVITNTSGIDPEWKARLEQRHAAAKAGLATRIENFRRTMPRIPPQVQATSDIGQAYNDVCGVGGIFSGTALCGNKYGYTDDDELYFEVDGDGLLIGRILDFTIDEWLASIVPGKDAQAP